MAKLAKTYFRGLHPKYRTPVFSVSAQERQKEVLNQLRSKYQRTGIALYVGAGIQQSIGLPGWRDLLGKLTIAMVAMKQYDDRASIPWRGSKLDLAAMRAAITAYNRPLLMMARAIKNGMGSVLPHEIAETLYGTGSEVSEYRYFRVIDADPQEPESDDDWPLPSSELVDALVAIVAAREGSGGVKAIVNYNYDDLLDLRLRESGIKAVTVTSGRQLAREGTVPCYHVHGVLPFLKYPVDSRKSSIGNFIFSEDEYHNEYANPYKWSNILQTSLLSSLSGLFVGLSLDDPDIRRLVDTTHRHFPLIQHYAILKRGRSMKVRGKSREDTVANLFEDVETQSFADMGLDILWVDEYEEIPNMIRYVGGLNQFPAKKGRTRD